MKSDFPKPMDVSWDVEGFALHRKGSMTYLLERQAKGEMLAHALKVQRRILQAMSKRQLRRISNLIDVELDQRSRG